MKNTNLRVGEDFYITHTSYSYAPGLVVWRSKDLVNWLPISQVANETLGEIWVPDLVEHGGCYFIYFSLDARLFVVYAEHPRGPGSAPVDLKLGGIDPGHIAGQDGKRCLHFAGGKAIELSADVWLCSGQSNMEMGMRLTSATNDIANANFPNIRLLTVPHGVALEPQQTIKCNWLPCSPATLSQGAWEGFSAVGYYFVRDLYQELHLPIGLTQSAWGGTIAEAWTSAETLTTMEDFKDPVAIAQAGVHAPKNLSYAQIYDQWYAQHEDGSKQGWQNLPTNVAGWQTVTMPRLFSRVGLGNFDCSVWFRREFNALESWPGAEGTVSLGQIDDEDAVWISGVEVGQTHRVDRDRNYGKSVWANAEIEGRGGALWAPGVSDPVTMRYAWDVNPNDFESSANS